jgi:hypothetical protein
VTVLVRAEPLSGRARAVLVAVCLVVPLFVVAFIPGYLDPTLTWRGYANYTLAKYGRFFFIGCFAWIEVWALYQLMLCSGRMGLVYGGESGSRGPWLGTWFALRLAPWRRVKCVPGLKVSVRVTPRVPPGAFDRTRVTLEAEGRRRKVQVISTPDGASIQELSAWLKERGVTRAVDVRPVEARGR